MAEEAVARNITVFSPETEFEGVLTFTDDLVIAGTFTGTIRATGNLTVEKNAVCRVDSVSVQSAVVYGTVHGDITADDRVEICSGGSVTGNIKAARLRIANNVEFNGRVTMVDKMPETDLFSSASQEFKNAFVIRANSIR